MRFSTATLLFVALLSASFLTTREFLSHTQSALPGNDGDTSSPTVESHPHGGSSSTRAGVDDRGRNDPIEAPQKPPAATLEELQKQLRDQLTKAPPRTWSSGDATLVGTVTCDGEPISGVEVAAVIFGLTPGAEPLPMAEVDFATYLQQELVQFQYDHAMMRKATSNADGGFVVEGVREDAEYFIYATKPGYWILNSRQEKIRPGTEIELNAVEVSEVDLRVVLQDSSLPQPTEADVFCGTRELFDRGRSQYWLSWSSANPRVRLPNTTEVIRVRTPRHSSATLPVDFLPVPAGEFREHTVTVGSLTGVEVSFDSPQNLSDGHLSLENTDSEQQPRGMQVVAGVETYFMEAPAGEYTLRYSGAAQSTEQQIRIVESTTTPVLLHVDQPLQTVEFHLRTADGSPVEMQHLSIEWDTAKPQHVRALGPGDYEVTVEASLLSPDLSLLEDNTVPPEFIEQHSQVSYQVEGVNCGDVEGSINPSSTAPIIVEFPRQCQLTVEVTNFLGHALQGPLAVYLGSTAIPLDLQGRGTARVPYGDHPVSFRLDSGNGYSSPYTLLVNSPRQRAELALPILYRVSIEYPLASSSSSGAGARAQRSDGVDGYWGRFDHGSYVFDAVPAGEYVFQIGNSDFMQAKVASDLWLTWKPAAMNGQRVIAVEEEFSLLQVGDIIVGLEGVHPEDAWGWRDAWVKAMAETDIELNVRRQRQTLAVTVTPDTLNAVQVLPCEVE